MHSFSQIISECPITNGNFQLNSEAPYCIITEICLDSYSETMCVRGGGSIAEQFIFV